MMCKKKLKSGLNRRQFLSAAVLTATAMVLDPSKMSWALGGQRSLSFYHTHTGERLDIIYGWPGLYDPIALEEINHFLRDFRTGEVHPIDPKLLDTLCAIRQKFGGQGTFEVISGYRSPKTNRQLRRRSSGVAKHSLHMDGKAIDIRLKGVLTRKIQQCALGMKCGGVGFYAKSDFVHLDTGRVRFW
jgi:uncharacterized protein YcbK (DUF882 family)